MSPSIAEVVNSYEATPDEERLNYELSTKVCEQDATQTRSGEDLIREHMRNIELLSQNRPRVQEFVIQAAYAPSASSLDTLGKISFNDLELEVHHRGSFVTAKTITPPYQSTKVITIIQETETGHVAKLVLNYDYDSILGTESNIPQNSTIAIKEPYCKFNGDGDYVICVDHPSDIAILRGDDAAVSMIMEFVSEKKEISPSQWKAAGDKAYLAKNYSSAIECYTQAIDTSPPEDHIFIRDTRRKRAFSNLTAKAFSAARDDALATCAGDSLDEKAYFYAGHAAYMLRDFKDSQVYLQKSLDMNPNDWKYQTEHARAVARVKEQEEGAYDFNAMAKSVSVHNVFLDHADFTANTKVVQTETRGRGLFATRDLKAGELVLCEKAFCLPDMYTSDEEANLTMYNFNSGGKTKWPAQSALFLQLLQKLYRNPDECGKFFELDGGKYIRSGREGTLVDSVPVIDTFLVEAIRLRNCFPSPRLTSSLLNANSKHIHSHSRTHGRQTQNLTTGLWNHASYLNHSCLPNCTRAFIGDMMIIRTNHAIPAHTELTHQYMTPSAHLSEREHTFPSNWQFTCDCALCTTERKSSSEKHKRRAVLTEKIKREVMTNPQTTQASTIRKIERLVRQLEDLHENEIYATIPRLLLIHPTIWLTEAYRRIRNSSKSVKFGLEVLRNFGHLDVMVERDGKWVIEIGGAGIVNSGVFNALRFLAEGFAALGKVELRRDCEREAGKMFVVLTGCGFGLDECVREGFWGAK